MNAAANFVLMDCGSEEGGGFYVCDGEAQIITQDAGRIVTMITSFRYKSNGQNFTEDFGPSLLKVERTKAHVDPSDISTPAWIGDLFLDGSGSEDELPFDGLFDFSDIFSSDLTS